MALTIAVVMPGHLSTTPRMLKAADSLADAGYDVRVISAGFLDWARESDERTASARPWQWRVVEHSRDRAPARYLTSGLRRHLARTVARAAGASRAPGWACSRAVSRVHDELVAAACAERPDFVIGGSIGGLAVAADIAHAAKIPYAVDLEDFHLSESVAPDAGLYHALARRIITRVAAGAAFVTTSSECIAARYAHELAIAPAVLHNVFRLPASKPRLDRGDGPIRLYWFSQTIAPGRGIEDMIEAVKHAQVPAGITLRGRSNNGFLQDLRARAAAVPGLTLQVEPPADPDRMVALSAEHDIGFSAEVEPAANRQLCLGNKVFTYLLGGVPVALNDTIAQRQFAGELREAAFLYSSSDVRPLGEWLRGLASAPGRLRQHREAAWQQAARRWHWQHQAEEGQLLSLVRRALGNAA
jgi:glycosyltransferase involved in cell wall biosynthesis